MTKKKNEQIANISSLLKITQEMKDLAKKEFMSLIRELSSADPITFNEDTGFPCYKDEWTPIVAVRVIEKDGKPILQFNDMCGEDEWGLDPDGWFCPDTNDLEYRIEEYLDCICCWMNERKD